MQYEVRCHTSLGMRYIKDWNVAIASGSPCSCKRNVVRYEKKLSLEIFSQAVYVTCWKKEVEQNLIKLEWNVFSKFWKPTRRVFIETKGPDGLGSWSGATQDKKTHTNTTRYLQNIYVIHTEFCREKYCTGAAFMSFRLIESKKENLSLRYFQRCLDETLAHLRDRDW